MPTVKPRTGKYRPDNLKLPLGTPPSPVVDVEVNLEGNVINPEEVIRTIESTEKCIVFEDLKIGPTLGSGQYGTVSRAIHARGDEKTEYAVKRVALENTDLNNPKNIIAEFKALYECKCDNIITMFDAFYREGGIHIVMEFMDCGSLEDIFKFCKVVPEPVLSYVSRQILLGLVYLHEEKGIVHRDIKPANILINSRGACKIADFGMSGHKSSVGSIENKDVVSKSWDTFQGTYTYMSPERIRGEKHSFNSDIWAVGLTLAECALGTFPFKLKENTIWEMMKHLEVGAEEPIDLSKEKFSEEFREFIFACLRFNQNERPSARQLLEFNFIKNHTKSNKFKRWLYEHYIEKRKTQPKR
ncbi:mitogen-activated protein kinase kinase [Acrasis kona]|uniref:mitogen-activated protein kinase kinase n=1 Tax=Acrasis kona TaxID=1008807 RepID=A0AAW2ZLJ5_9EUKA